MKRLPIAAILAAALTLPLAACGSSEPTNDTAAEAAAYEPTQEEVDQWVHDAAQGASWEVAIASSEWRSGNLWVLMQLDREADKEVAESAAKLMANTAKLQREGNEIDANVGYIIVANGVGEQMKQEKVN